MKKILFVTRPMVPPWHEGSKKLVWQIAVRLTRFEPHLLTASAQFDLPDDTTVRKHPIYRGADLTLAEKMRLLWFLLWRFPQVDLLHSYFVPTLLTSLLLRLVRWLHGRPLIQTVPALPDGQLTPRHAQRLFFGDRVVTYSDASAKRLAALGVRGVDHIDVGVDDAPYREATRCDALRKRLGCGEDDALVLFSGEYSRLGAVERLKRIIPQTVLRAPHVRYVIACRILVAADREVEAAFQAWVHDSGFDEWVCFVGEVNNFAELLTSADLFIFPVVEMLGKIETPLTLVEAMLAGLPIVSTNLPSLLRTCPDNTAVLLPPDDDARFAQTIVSLANHKATRRALGDRGQSYAAARFGLERMVARYEELYDAII